MNWTTLYITGRDDFREDVRRRLENSKVDFMPGYIDGSVGSGTYDLYWLNETVPLREFKEAIGGKLIWKYRLRFHLNLEEFLQAVDRQPANDDFSDEDTNLISAMRKSA